VGTIAPYRVCPHCREGVGRIIGSALKGARRQRRYKCNACDERWEVYIRQETIEVVVRYKNIEMKNC
jgi:transcriptional regulator NrdR family protein